MWPDGSLTGQRVVWAVQAVWSEQAQQRQWDLTSCLFLLFFNLLHCPRLGFLGSRLTLRLVFTGYIRECSWDQHLGKGGGERKGGEGRAEEGQEGSRIGSRESSGWAAGSVEASADPEKLSRWEKNHLEPVQFWGVGSDLYSPH